MSSRIATLLLVVWACAGLVVGAVLMRPHWVPLSVPPVEISGPTGSPATDGWSALHALQADCGCSRRVLAHLGTRPPELGVREHILWVSDGPDAGESFPAGYEVERLNGATLARAYRLPGVPVLSVIDPGGGVRYRGGYTARKQGYEIRDREIIRGCRAGAPPSPLPVYGCAAVERFGLADRFGGGFPSEVP